MTDKFDPEELAGVYARLDPESRCECDLWRAVIAQAIRDLTSVDVDLALDSVLWLGSKDYRDCCALALLDPVALEGAIRSVMAIETPLYRRKEASRLADKINAGVDTDDQEENVLSI